MTSEESRYADILIARGAQRKHLAKETEILQTEAARLGRTDGEIKIGKSILPKGFAVGCIGRRLLPMTVSYTHLTLPTTPYV